MKLASTFHSGICFNCQRGTEGSRCQHCSANVTGANCDSCAPHFWWAEDTDDPTCLDCGCGVEGTLAGTTCSPVTGACTCVDSASVDGLRCDRCSENYVNLTAARGCTPCPVCYRLVADEVAAARSFVGNTSTFSYRFANVSFVAFGKLAAEVGGKLDTLTSYVRYVALNNASIAATLTALNQSMASRLIGHSRTNSTPFAECASLLDETGKQSSYLSATYVTLTERTAAVDVLREEHLDPIVAQLNATYWGVATAVERSREEVSSLRREAAEVTENQHLVSNSSSLATRMQQLIGDSMSNNSLVYASAVDNLRRANTDAEVVPETLTRARDNVARCEAALGDVGVPSIAVPGDHLQARITEVRNSAYEINIAALQGVRTSPDREINNVASRTSKLGTRTAQYAVDASNLAAASAGDDALRLAAAVGGTADSATYMLSIMRDFDARATAMRREVNASLGVVSSIHELSLAVYNASMALKTQLHSLRTTSLASVEAIAAAKSTYLINGASEITSRFVASVIDASSY